MPWLTSWRRGTNEPTLSAHCTYRRYLHAMNSSLCVHSSFRFTSQHRSIYGYTVLYSTGSTVLRVRTSFILLVGSANVSVSPGIRALRPVTLVDQFGNLTVAAQCAEDLHSSVASCDILGQHRSHTRTLQGQLPKRNPCGPRHRSSLPLQDPKEWMPVDRYC